MRLRRLLTVLTLAVLATAGLTACQTKIGQAASVNGVTLSDNDVSDLVQRGSEPYTEQGSTVIPKVNAIETWVQTQLLRAAITKRGGDPTTAETTAAHTALFGSGGTDQLVNHFTGLGYSSKFGNLLVDEEGLLVVLLKRLAPQYSVAQLVQALQGGQANAVIVSAVKAAKAKVTVSARYGGWDDAKLRVPAGDGAGAPGFVKIAGATSATSG